MGFLPVPAVGLCLDMAGVITTLQKGALLINKSLLGWTYVRIPILADVPTDPASYVDICKGLKVIPVFVLSWGNVAANFGTDGGRSLMVTAGRACAAAFPSTATSPGCYIEPTNELDVVYPAEQLAGFITAVCHLIRNTGGLAEAGQAQNPYQQFFVGALQDTSRAQKLINGGILDCQPANFTVHAVPNVVTSTWATTVATINGYLAPYGVPLAVSETDILNALDKGTQYKNWLVLCRANGIKFCSQYQAFDDGSMTSLALQGIMLASDGSFKSSCSSGLVGDPILSLFGT